MAIFSSPLLTIAANPQSILDNPAVELIRSIPAVWDETIVLPDSKIGELAAYARRTGDTWFLAVMNGTTARTIQVSLSFLGRGQYRAFVVSDDPKNDASVKIENVTHLASDTLTIGLVKGGGFITRFSKQ